MRLTIAESFAVRALSHPDRIAIEVLDGGPSLTYAEAWRRVVALAGAVEGVAEGRHGRMVGLLLPNGADAILAFLACQVAGAAAVPINSRLAEPEIAFVLEDAGAKLVLSDGKVTEEGNHDELILQYGTYADLWHIQSGDFGVQTD